MDPGDQARDCELPGARAPRAVRRTPEGVIDIGYHERRARRLRVRWMHMWLRTTIRRLVRWRRRRALAMELHALDDRDLHDMGLNRGDIAAIASGSYALDETRRWRGGNRGGEASGHGATDASAWSASGADDAAR